MRVMMDFDFTMLSLVELREAKDELARELQAREKLLSAPIPDNVSVKPGDSILIAKIKAYRALVGCSLRDAKDKVDGRI